MSAVYVTGKNGRIYRVDSNSMYDVYNVHAAINRAIDAGDPDLKHAKMPGRSFVRQPNRPAPPAPYPSMRSAQVRQNKGPDFSHGFAFVAPRMSFGQRMIDDFRDEISHRSPLAFAARAIRRAIPIDLAYRGALERQRAAAGGYRPRTREELARESRARVTAAENEWRRLYDMRHAADPAWRKDGSVAGNAARVASSALGRIGGSLLSDPSNYLTPGRNLAIKLLAQSGISATVDGALQAAELGEGTRGSWDPLQTGIAAVSGPVFAGLSSAARHLPTEWVRDRWLRYHAPPGSSAGAHADATRPPVLRPERPVRLEDIDPARITSGTGDYAGLILVDGKPWKMPKPPYYSVANSMTLPAGRIGAYPDTQRRLANESLYRQMREIPGAEEWWEELIPGIGDALAAGKNPPSWEWDHNFERPGEQNLIPRQQHRDPAYRENLHPDGKGGYANFSRPAGAPPRGRKKKKR